MKTKSMQPGVPQRRPTSLDPGDQLENADPLSHILPAHAAQLSDTRQLMKDDAAGSPTTGKCGVASSLSGCIDLTRVVNRQRIRVAAALLALAALYGCQPGSGPAMSSTDPQTVAQLIQHGGDSGVSLDAASLRVAGITLSPAAVRDVQRNLRLAGQIAPTSSSAVPVTARLPGRIAAVFVQSGSRVTRGQVLATVDSVDLTQAEAAYQSALSHERLTLDQLNQQKRLAAFGALSEQPVEDARRAYSAAQAAVASDTAQIRLDRLSLANTHKLVAMGETTRKPVEDAQNAYAQALASQTQAKVALQSAKATLDRTRILYKGGIYSRQQMEDATTAYQNGAAALAQAQTQESLAAAELARQNSIYSQNLNGASALQAAQSKLQQDQHQYSSDLTSETVTRRELARALAVRKSGIPVSQALQQAQDAYGEAQVALQGAENTLRLYGVSPSDGAAQLQNGDVLIPVTAPISGVVAGRNMAAGQITDTSTPLARIVNLSDVYVDAQVFERDIAGVQPGDPVTATVSAYPGQTFTGRVQYIGTEVSPDTRTVTVRTTLANPGWLLRPGMFATVNVSSQPRRELTVPAGCLLEEGERHVVYLEVAPQRFVERTVVTGAPVNGLVPVRSGLAPGDRVVNSGNLLLQNEQHKLEDESRGAA